MFRSNQEFLQNDAMFRSNQELLQNEAMFRSNQECLQNDAMFRSNQELLQNEAMFRSNQEFLQNDAMFRSNQELLQNDAMDIIPNSRNDQEAITAECSRLLKENAELRKLMGFMQENKELRLTLKDHEKSSKRLPIPGEHKKDHQESEKVKKCQRIVGEIAFQLDRRILAAIFVEQHRLYGYRVSHIAQRIIQVTTNPQTGKVNENLRSELHLRYHHVMEQLHMLGYIPEVHSHFTENLVNTYGIMKDRKIETEEFSSINDPQYLSNMITECMPSHSVKNILIILKCLAHLAKKDGKPLFCLPSSEVQIQSPVVTQSSN
ncbi:uncharacterized protein LOC142243904 isoform X2 [Anomaloglossus baeobatrachus]|uniref:uncharacterized protein LOC142243904 isoform X2 n=1 Tax=Anomaloglossus baeobatrachus TaxID=238106 RepID=UPI003F4FB815